jgi:MFS family permease
MSILTLDPRVLTNRADAVDEIQGENPGIFGRNGGYSRAISVVSMSWTLGMFIGPILSGYGTEHIGYYGINCALGK